MKKPQGFKKGYIPWNKGTKGIMKPNKTSFKKGHRAPKTAFKKGHIPWSKNKKLFHLWREKHWNWKGGKTISRGYICIYKPDYPFSKHNYVFEHHLIMEKHLKRYLKPSEVVHHINGDKSDNRIENLMLFSNNIEHLKFHRQNS